MKKDVLCEVCFENKGIFEVDKYGLVCEDCYNDFIYCELCDKPIYSEDYGEYYTLNGGLYCVECYFKERESISEKAEIKHKGLKALDKYVKDNNVKTEDLLNFLDDVYFKFDCKNSSNENIRLSVSFEPFKGITLNSFYHNIWVWITDREDLILKGLEYVLNNELNIELIGISKNYKTIWEKKVDN